MFVPAVREVRRDGAALAAAAPTRSGLVLLFGSGSPDVCGRGVSATHPGNPVDFSTSKDSPAVESGTLLLAWREESRKAGI